MGHRDGSGEEREVMLGITCDFIVHAFWVQNALCLYVFCVCAFLCLSVCTMLSNTTEMFSADSAAACACVCSGVVTRVVKYVRTTKSGSISRAQ